MKVGEAMEVERQHVLPLATEGFELAETSSRKWMARAASRYARTGSRRRFLDGCRWLAGFAAATSPAVPGLENIQFKCLHIQKRRSSCCTPWARGW